MEAKNEVLRHSVWKPANGLLDDLDSAQLRRIFPEEIWSIIGKKLLKEYSGDLENLANSSSFFRKILAPERTNFLFENVFPLVISSIWNKNGLQGIMHSEILKLRGVSKYWNHVIDHSINGLLRKYRFKLVNKTRFSNILDRTNTTIGAGSVYGFLQHFADTHPGNHLNERNPFIWGNISLTVLDDVQPDYNLYLADISLLFARHGSHVHQLSVKFEGNVLGVAARLRDWLLHCPHLKSLKLSGDVDEWRRSNFICRLMFPTSQFLEKLDATNLSAHLFNQLIRKNRHISELTIGNMEDDYKFFTFPMHNLRKLGMKNISTQNMIKLRSPLVNWRLESLTFSVECLRISTGCATHLQIIQEKFSSSLVHLDLKVENCAHKHATNYSVWNDFNDCRLNLPKLKKISIQMNGELANFNLDFLLLMKNNLEEIRIVIGQNNSETSGIIIQFEKIEEKIYESNTWTIFKFLKKIEITAYWNELDSTAECKCFYRDNLIINKF